MFVGILFSLFGEQKTRLIIDMVYYAMCKACSWYYECEDSCALHKQCKPTEDGLPRVFDEIFEW